MNLSQQTRELVQQYQSWQEALHKEKKGNTIQVDEVAAKVAAFYEKIRGVVDWREEHLLRKTAIERVLKRRLLLKKNGEEIAERLLQELVRGGHFPNDRIPITIIPKVQHIIDKYVYIIEQAPPDIPKEFKLNNVRELDDWLLGVAASEIEEMVSPPKKELALIAFTAKHMEEQIDIALSDEDKTYQIYVAVQNALFKLDETTITQHLFLKLYPDWNNLQKERLSYVALNIHEIRKNINDILRHPLSERIYQHVEKYDTPYLLLGDIVEKEPHSFNELAQSPPELEESVRQAYNVRLAKLKKKLRRAALYSILSIFITKMLIAVSIEIPLDRYLIQHPTYYPLLLSIGVPSLLMLFLVLGAKPSSKENAQKVLMEVMKIVYGKERQDSYQIFLKKKRKGILTAFVYGSYLLSFLISFGLLIFVLQKLNFTVPSIIIFLSFISLVAFAGTVIRQRSKELLIIEQKEGILYGLFDIFFLPIVRAGKLLSRNLARYNVVIMMFNVFLEIPFQIFIEFLEQWRALLKEKKEEIH